jgi:hypothetical protein
MIAVIYPRKDKLVFLIKNIESHYSDYNLETTGKPDTDYIIKSATKYVLVKNLDDVEKAIGLLQIASG